MIPTAFAPQTPRVRSLRTTQVLSPPRQFEGVLGTQIEAQRSGFDLKRRKRGASKFSSLAGNERYGTAFDEKQDKGLASKPPLCPLTSARSADSFKVVGTGVLSA